MWVDAGRDFLLTDPGYFGVPTVCLVGDTHTGQRQWRIDYACGFEWTRLMFARQDLPAFAAAGVRRLGWLPAACEPEIHRRFAVPKAYDLVFVGQTLPQWHQDRVRLLERLRQAGFDLRVDSRVLEEMALLFSRARLVFNRSLNGDLNMRVFEALASGSMLLTDRLPAAAGLEDLLADRRHLVLYDDADLEDLARYYLDHESEREAIAAAGYQEAIGHHTYGHRVDALLSDVFGADTCATCVAPAAAAAPVPRGAAASTATAPAAASAASLPDYYRNSRPELAELVPATARRVLEIGCAAGEMGRLLKSQRPGIQVVGIEREEAAAALARQHLDGVIRGDIESLADLPYPVGWFDCLVFGDVLEHLREPEVILRRLLAWLAADGAVVASIPNVRHQSVLLELMVNGRWQYRDEGLLDRTHLRFFTLAEVRALLAAAGLRPDQIHASQSPPWPQLDAFVRATEAVGGDGEALRREAQVIQYLVRAVRVERSERQGPRVSLVIPVYNRAELTEQCLLALAENTGDDPDYEVIVVDNGSTDWTPYLLHAFEGDLQVLRHDDNLGFARACNRGAEAARGDLLLFLNNDTVARPGWLAALVAAADSDPQIGIVGARLLYPGGERVQHAGLEMRHGVPEHFGRNLPWNDPSVTASRDLDMVTGACMLVRRQLFADLGGFDPEFVNGVEDVDLCLRGRDRGFRVVYCADSVIEHHEGQTEGRFTHAQQNLQRFAARWGHRFGPDGRLRPEAPTSCAPAAPAAAPIGSGSWEGPFLVHSSLAHANRELVLALLARGRVDLGLRCWAADPPAADLDGPRWAPLAARFDRAPTASAAFHVRHGWPPDFAPPPGGRLVLMQPWEFGRIPREWVEPLARVDQIWAYTHYVRQCYIDSGVDPDRLQIVPLGVDPVHFAPGAVPLPLATERRCRFLFVGGTLYRKGIDVLLDAYTRAFTARDDVCLVIKDMGTRTFYRGQHAGERIRALQANPEGPQILYLTEDLAPADMPRLYAACTCLVHPYRGEGFGLPVAEAMACGLPVIVTAGGACDDFCRDGLAVRLPSRRVAIRFAVPTVGSAWLLEPDAGALQQAMLDVCGDPRAGQAMGQRASAFVRTQFTWDQAAARAEAALQQCLDGPGPAPASGDRLGVILFGEATPEALTACVEAWGTAVRHLPLGDDGQGLGPSLEARRLGFAGALLAMGPAASPVPPAALQALTAALAADPEVGVAVLDGGGSEAAHPVPSVGRDWQVWRLSALAEVGGFAAGFRTAAVLDETARQLRRQGWRVIGLGTTQARPAAPVVPAEVAESAAVAALIEGDRQYEAGDLAAAAAAWRQALAGKPDFVEARLVLASLLQDTGHASEAVGVLAELVALDPRSARAVALLGAAQCRAGDLAAAHPSLSRALELAPDDVQILCDLAVVELRQGQSASALSRLERAARLAPEDAALAQHIARLRTEAGQAEAAMEQLRAYLGRHPGELPVMGALLDILIAAGRHDEGRTLAAAILRLDPGHARAAAVVHGDGG
jgi:GT2 family glycosyltransferase/glycosyltransferase involved in cell wall biosynthesis/tetratricopeptide (TPR) repeat protein/SAM-dependent methyltransferase